MLFLAPANRRLRGFRLTQPTLALQKATYQTGASVTLVFNQPIDITAVAINSVQLSDGPGGHIYVGQAASLVDPSTVRLTLAPVTSDTGPNVTLDFDSPTGIRTIPMGQEWPGAVGLALPYP